MTEEIILAYSEESTTPAASVKITLEGSVYFTIPLPYTVRTLPFQVYHEKSELDCLILQIVLLK